MGRCLHEIFGKFDKKMYLFIILKHQFINQGQQSGKEREDLNIPKLVIRLLFLLEM